MQIDYEMFGLEVSELNTAIDDGYYAPKLSEQSVLRRVASQRVSSIETRMNNNCLFLSNEYTCNVVNFMTNEQFTTFFVPVKYNGKTAVYLKHDHLEISDRIMKCENPSQVILMSVIPVGDKFITAPLFEIETESYIKNVERSYESNKHVFFKSYINFKNGVCVPYQQNIDAIIKMRKFI